MAELDFEYGTPIIKAEFREPISKSGGYEMRIVVSDEIQKSSSLYGPQLKAMESMTSEFAVKGRELSYKLLLDDPRYTADVRSTEYMAIEVVYGDDIQRAYLLKFNTQLSKIINDTNCDLQVKFVSSYIPEKINNGNRI